MKILICFLVSISSLAQAGEYCCLNAISTAQDTQLLALRPYEIKTLDTKKNQESYIIRLVDSYDDPTANAVVEVTLLKSDCSVTSKKIISN